MPVLLPWQLFHALHHAGPENFLQATLGKGGESAARMFFAFILA